MALTLLKSQPNYSDENLSKNTVEKIEKTLTEEFVIGICATIGSLKDDVLSSITHILENDYKYRVVTKTLSKFIEENAILSEEKIENQTNGYKKLMNKINGGNELRKKFGNDVLVNLAVQEINTERLDHFQEKLGKIPDITELESQRICYIIDSLKNREELKLLRSVYREMFYLFSIFSPTHERKENLRTKHDLSDSEIEKIINTDEYENTNFGQDVRNTFIEADFFVRVAKKYNNQNLEINKFEIENKMKRYFHLIFESNVVTPLKSEIAMYQAKSAAGNSACLSRQVGAAITDMDGNVLSKGWNDVPKFGGNLYNEDDQVDLRCAKNGKYCRNDREKDNLTNKILELIRSDNKLIELYNKEKQQSNLDEFLEHLNNIVRNSSRIKDLVEFSRAVHAEMHAIIIGSQLSGSKMQGGKLFTTTYPCHNCARHIIAAGITEIYYIQPYVSSLGTSLHDDALTENELDNNKVKLLIYDGVAPRRYLEFFSFINKRKEKSGEKTNILPNEAKPKSRLTLQALSTLEYQATHSLNQSGLKIK